MSIFILLIWLPSLSHSQTVQGTITDPLTDDGIPNLTVAIGDCTTVTDSLGHYVINLGEVTSVEGVNEGQNLPRTFDLFQNYPNPFNAETTIRYQLPKDSNVTVRIINLLGQETITFMVEEQAAGEYQIRWNGLDYRGKQVSSGIYIVSFVADAFVKSRKILLLK